MDGWFELMDAAMGQFFFRLKAANGETILSSEQYTTKSGAEAGIAAVRTNAPAYGRYARRSSAAGQPYFVLKGENSEILGTSEMYATGGAMERGIDAVRDNAPRASTKDLTR